MARASIWGSRQRKIIAAKIRTGKKEDNNEVGNGTGFEGRGSGRKASEILNSAWKDK